MSCPSAIGLPQVERLRKKHKRPRLLDGDRWTPRPPSTSSRLTSFPAELTSPAPGRSVFALSEADGDCGALSFPLDAGFFSSARVLSAFILDRASASACRKNLFSSPRSFSSKITVVISLPTTPTPRLTLLAACAVLLRNIVPACPCLSRPSDLETSSAS